MGIRLQPSLLLLFVLLRPGSAGSAAYSWHVYEYEFNFFEDILVIVFVFLALSFEILWHGLGGGAEHSYRYGKYHEQAAHHPVHGRKDHGNPTHPQLYNELYHRMGGEFMTLGILAFMIFSFNQLGGFNKLAGVLMPCGERCFHHPITEEQWLHLAELVHVKLFVGMLLYYVLIFYLVRGSVHQIQQWEKLRLRRIQAAAPGVPAETRALDRDLEKHIQWREYFIEHVLRIHRCRPDTFRQVQRSVARACETEHPSVAARCSFDSSTSADVEQKLRQSFEKRFSLSAYLAVNLEYAVLDSIQVHKPTWAVLLCLFGLFSLLHYAAHLALGALVPAIIGVAFVILILMWYLSKESQSMIKRNIRQSRLPSDKAVQCLEEGRSSSTIEPSMELRSNPDTPLDQAKKVGIHERFNTETVVLRALQVFLFLISYVFSQTLLDGKDWKTNTRVTLLNTLGFTVLFLVMARFLPDMVPVFISVMAFPPHVDEANLAAFFSVLYEEEQRLAEDDELNHELQAAQTGDGRSHEAADDVSGVEIESSSSLQATGPTQFEAVRELADLLGVGEQLEKRLSERSPRPASSRHPL